MSKTAQDYLSKIQQLEEKLERVRDSKPKDRRQFDQVYDRLKDALREAGAFLLKSGWEVEKSSGLSADYASGHSDVKSMVNYCWLQKPGFQQIDLTKTSQDKATVEALKMEAKHNGL